MFVPLTVMLELEWVLRSRYRFSKDAVLSALVNLLETREIEFQDEASVERALFFYRSKRADFAECLHLGCAVTHDRLPLVTFDRQAAGLEGAKLPGRPVSSKFDNGADTTRGRPRWSFSPRQRRVRELCL